MSRDELAQEARNYYGLLPELGEKVGYIRYFEDIFFLLRKREALLKTPRASSTSLETKTLKCA